MLLLLLLPVNILLGQTECICGQELQSTYNWSSSMDHIVIVQKPAWEWENKPTIAIHSEPQITLDAKPETILNPKPKPEESKEIIEDIEEEEIDSQYPIKSPRKKKWNKALKGKKRVIKYKGKCPRF